MPRDDWKKSGRKRAHDSLQKKIRVDDADELKRQQGHAARHGGTEDEVRKRERMFRGMTQFPRFKKVGDHYESPYTGIMLSSAQEFDTFSEFFRDGELNVADIKCKIGEPYSGCKTLQEVRDKVAGEGKHTGKPTLIKRGKHEFSWTVILSEKQMDDMKAAYTKGLGKSEDGGAGTPGGGPG
jgi:hypothetical protein